MKDVCTICGKRIPVEPKFRSKESKEKGARADPRIRHLQDDHDMKDVTALGTYFVEAKPAAEQKPSNTKQLTKANSKLKEGNKTVATNPINGKKATLEVKSGRLIISSAPTM